MFVLTFLVLKTEGTSSLLANQSLNTSASRKPVLIQKQIESFE